MNNISFAAIKLKAHALFDNATFLSHIELAQHYFSKSGLNLI